MIVFLSVVALALGALLGYAEATRGRMVVRLAICVQVVAILGLLLLSEGYHRPVAAFLLGTLVGAAAAKLGSQADRRRTTTRDKS
jgi:MFS-type transporter involved in bile tolerance (Atg22 family)